MLYNLSTTTRWGYRDISALAVFESGAAAAVVDVREPYEYASGHVPGALLVPVANVPVALRSWNRHDDIVVVCRSGARSARVAEALTSAGFTRVMNLAGGMLAYMREGLPVALGSGSGSGSVRSVEGREAC